MSRPPTSKPHRRCFSSWMPQESRNNLVQQKPQKKQKKKNKRGTKGKRARVSLCVCRGGRSVSGVPSSNNAAATQSVLLWWEYCSLGPSSMHRRRLGLLFFLNPFTPHTNTSTCKACLLMHQPRGLQTQDARRNLWGVSRNVSVTQQVWKPTHKAVRWHVVWSLHHIRVPYEGVWIHKCICMEVFGKTKRKKETPITPLSCSW